MRRRVSAGAGVAPLVLVVAVLVAACGATAGSSASDAVVPPTADPSSSIALPAASPAASPAATLPMPSDAQVIRDPSLLAILPSRVGGVQVIEEPDAFAPAVADPSFIASVDRAVFATAYAGTDIASGVVAHLRPGVYSDAMFADWRSSYDEGACAQAGGVVSHAQSTAGGRTIYVTTCGGGLRVYHTYVASKGAIVSLFSTGPADLGGQMMGALAG